MGILQDGYTVRDEGCWQGQATMPHWCVLSGKRGASRSVGAHPRLLSGQRRGPLVCSARLPPTTPCLMSMHERSPFGWLWRCA